jgi:hypothetical protein
VDFVVDSAADLLEDESYDLEHFRPVVGVRGRAHSLADQTHSVGQVSMVLAAFDPRETFVSHLTDVHFAEKCLVRLRGHRCRSVQSCTVPL